MKIAPPGDKIAKLDSQHFFLDFSHTYSNVEYQLVNVDNIAHNSTGKNIQLEEQCFEIKS